VPTPGPPRGSGCGRSYHRQVPKATGPIATSLARGLRLNEPRQADAREKRSTRRRTEDAAGVRDRDPNVPTRARSLLSACQAGSCSKRKPGHGARSLLAERTFTAGLRTIRGSASTAAVESAIVSFVQAQFFVRLPRVDPSANNDLGRHLLASAKSPRRHSRRDCRSHDGVDTSTAAIGVIQQCSAAQLAAVREATDRGHARHLLPMQTGDSAHLGGSPAIGD
jgi:hypothetical protein